MGTSKEVLGALPTEARNAGTAGFDAMSGLAMVQAMHAADVEAVAAVERALPEVAAVVEAAAARVGKGGRLLYFGAGTSGRLGVLDASECPPTFCTPPEMVQGVIAGGERALRFAVEGAEDDFALGESAAQELQVREMDVVVGIAASGRTPYVLGAMAAGRAVGALTVGVSCVPGSPVELAGRETGALYVTMATGAEVVTGSTRLKAGTATKLVLNMISTGVLARLGYVYGNLMVNVQPTNAKLRDRAVRIVMELTKLARDEAAELLVRADGVVKTAVVMHARGVNADAARGALERTGGRLREAL
jgi:N-acetylmuramic acid 6-phosphate etherase